MKIETKIKMLTSLMVSAFVLVILFLAIQISQERRMYNLDKRITYLENIINQNNVENVNYSVREISGEFYIIGAIQENGNILKSINNTLNDINNKLSGKKTIGYEEPYVQTVQFLRTNEFNGMVSIDEIGWKNEIRDLLRDIKIDVYHIRRWK